MSNKTSLGWHTSTLSEKALLKHFLDAQVSLAPTLIRLSVGPYVISIFWDLTKRRGDIAVADMVADMEVHMLADKKKEEKKWPTWS